LILAKVLPRNANDYFIRAISYTNDQPIYKEANVFSLN